LNNNVSQWKKEIEDREKEVANNREILNKERILLTNELLQEREEDLEIEEEEIYKYKQDRFGPNGDFILQKKQLIQPIQDQIFLAIQQLAKERKYDFIFDKSADIVMLYSNKRYDISDQILRTILRTNNQNQVRSRKEKKSLEKASIVSKVNTESPKKVEEESEKSLAEERMKKIIEERELKKAEAAEKIKKILDEKEAKKKKIIEEKKKYIEERKKILEEKRKKIQEARKAKLDAQMISKDSTFTKKL